MPVNSNTDSVLAVVREKDSVTFLEVEKALRIPKEEIIQALIELKSWGYGFKLTDDTISLAEIPDTLIDTEIMYQLNTNYIGKKVFSYQSLQSTNETAHIIADSDKSEGTVVTSEEQTKGKGRLGRVWFSKLKAGVYLSIILKPNFRPENAPGLSIMTSIALADVLSEISDAKVQIKWPNDVLLNGKKVAGILTELTADKENINHIIVGVGINVNHTEPDFPDDIQNIATSIRRETGDFINRIELIQKFLRQFEKLYDDYKIVQLEKLTDKVKSYSSLIERHIKLNLGNSIIAGKVLDINNAGELVLDTQGEIITVNSGEVTIVKE